METVSVVVFNSKAISFVNPIAVLFDVIYLWCWNWWTFFSNKFVYFLILFLMWVSLKSRGRSLMMHTFVTLFLFLIVRAEHSRPFAISFGVYSSMLLVPQWITTYLIAGGNSSFSARHNKFSTLSPRMPQFSVSFRKNKFHTFVYLESPWINESPSNTVCIFLFTFNVDVGCWYNLCHPGL